MDMIADAIAWLAGMRKTYTSAPITYIRGAQNCTIQATFLTQVMRVTDHQGNTKVERPDASFVFTAADLNFGAGQVEPASGDLIHVTFGAITKEFRLCPFNHGAEPAWHYEDPFETSVIVFSMFTGNV